MRLLPEEYAGLWQPLQWKPLSADPLDSMHRRAKVEPRWMPIIVATLGGNKRLRRVEYRVVRTPMKVGRVKLNKVASSR